MVQNQVIVLADDSKKQHIMQHKDSSKTKTGVVQDLSRGNVASQSELHCTEIILGD